MSKQTYNQLDTETRYHLLHRIWDNAWALLGKNEWLPTPGQVCHCDYDNLPSQLQEAINHA